MPSKNWIPAALMACVVLAAGIALRADEPLASPYSAAIPEAYALALAGDPLAHRAADHARAGCAPLLRPHAIPSNTRFYGGYWVGGGKPRAGDGPFAHEGTFGWDYTGILFRKRVGLSWWHGQRYQGGRGAYSTDGPRIARE